MRLRLTIYLETGPEDQQQGGYGNMQLSETVDIGQGTFLEIAGILGKFHDLSEVVAAERRQAVAP